jgi:hypothetical protein
VVLVLPPARILFYLYASGVLLYVSSLPPPAAPRNLARPCPACPSEGWDPLYSKSVLSEHLESSIEHQESSIEYRGLFQSNAQAHSNQNRKFQKILLLSTQTLTNSD